LGPWARCGLHRACQPREHCREANTGRRPGCWRLPERGRRRPAMSLTTPARRRAHEQMGPRAGTSMCDKTSIALGDSTFTCWVSTPSRRQGRLASPMPVMTGARAEGSVTGHRCALSAANPEVCQGLSSMHAYACQQLPRGLWRGLGQLDRCSGPTQSGHQSTRANGCTRTVSHRPGKRRLHSSPTSRWHRE